MGVLIVRPLLLGTYFRAPDVWKLPHGDAHSGDCPDGKSGSSESGLYGVVLWATVSKAEPRCLAGRGAPSSRDQSRVLIGLWYKPLCTQVCLLDFVTNPADYAQDSMYASMMCFGLEGLRMRTLLLGLSTWHDIGVLRPSRIWLFL